jgi:hypothetical protein
MHLVPRCRLPVDALALDLAAEEHPPRWETTLRRKTTDNTLIFI